LAADGDGSRDSRDKSERVHAASIVARLAAGELERGREDSARKLLAAALAMLEG
jgi:hypothetical protein